MQEAERKTGLVLTRKVTESVSLHTPEGEIRVQVIRIQGNRVRLRFEAPGSVKIDRSEIIDAPQVGES